MTGWMAKRLQELRAEQLKGRRTLEQVDQQRATLQRSVDQITGAIAVLEEGMRAQAAEQVSAAAQGPDAPSSEVPAEPVVSPTEPAEAG